MKNKIFFLFLLLLAHFSQGQERKLALVIGNSNYQHGESLKNPVNDSHSDFTGATDNQQVI